MPEKVKAGIQYTDHGQLMGTITKKAMSVVTSPIVPTLNDGRLDHERFGIFNIILLFIGYLVI